MILKILSFFFRLNYQKLLHLVILNDSRIEIQFFKEIQKK